MRARNFSDSPGAFVNIVTVLAVAWIVYAMFTTPKEGDVPAGVNTYRNERYGFELNYPDSFALEELNRSEGYFSSTRLAVAKIFQKDSNVSATVYADSARESVENCYEVDPYTRRTLTDRKTIRGVVFFTREYPDSAMGGQRARMNDYRTVRNGTCYQLETAIRYRESAQFYEYPSDVARDAARLEEGRGNEMFIKEATVALNSIVQSFKFIPPSR
ncbi:MAG: hypothetical protein HYY10_02135 [Candidatus Liptonbacteria bacterium]|nr:hypothetical protein [Candidatus Liptonbacteria bacterium]